MRAPTSTAFLLTAFLVPAAVLAQSSDNDGCTNATLIGDYAFRISGNLLPSGGPAVSRDGVAMTHFDGEGGVTQVDFVMSNGSPLSGPTDPLTGFHVGEHGRYQVNHDCTGRATITFPTPPGLESGAVIELMFVLGERGRIIHAIVSNLVPPGSTTPIAVSIHSDAEKL